MIDTTNMTTRPFDMAAARIGAPYATRGGQRAKIFKWDGPGAHSIIGIFGLGEIPAKWTPQGYFAASRGSYHEDLVMTPLGMVDGQPFFCGDTIIGATGYKFTAEPRDQDGDHDRWHLPAKVSSEASQ